MAKPRRSTTGAARATAPPVSRRAPAELLADCVRLAEAGDWPAALDGLLDAWRAAPSAALGDRVIRVGEVARTPATWPTDSPPPGAAVPSLLETLNEKGSVQGRARLEAVATWPGDPRIDRWVARHYREVPFTSTGARPWWTRLLPLAQRIVDPVAAKALRELTTEHDWVRQYLDRIAAALGEIGDVEPSAEARAQLAALDAALDAHAEASRPARADLIDQLLDAVLADPTDDQSRVVLGDALVELGHPRGELIALQMAATRGESSAATRRRERELIKHHRAELLGPLDAALRPGCTFAKGFLARAALRRGSSGVLLAAIANTVGHPLWATVEHLEGPKDRDVVRHPVMRSLRSLAITDAETDWLAQHPRLEALAGRHIDDKLIAAFEDASTFPALRELEAHGYPFYVAPVLASPVASRLHRLHVRMWVESRDHPDGATEALARAAACPVPELTLRFDKFRDEDWACGFRFTRAERGFDVHVFVTDVPPSWQELVFADLVRGLDAIAQLGPRRLVLERGLTTPELQGELVERVRAAGGVLGEAT